MSTVLLYVLTVVTWAVSGTKPWNKDQFKEFKEAMEDQAHGGVHEFNFLHHKKEIAGEIGNIIAEWKPKTRGKWEARVNDLLGKAHLGSLAPAGSKPSYIWVGVGSTTSQAFYVINGEKPTAIYHPADTTGDTFGFLFGSKAGTEKSAERDQLTKATAFLKLLAAKRKQIADAAKPKLKPENIPIFFAKSIAFALKPDPTFKTDKGRIASLSDPRLALDPDAKVGIMATGKYKGTDESVLSVKALHNAHHTMGMKKVFLLRCGAGKIGPPADFAHFEMQKKDKGETVVDIGGGSISANLKQLITGDIKKGEKEQGKGMTSNDLYDNGNTKKTPTEVADALLKDIAELENENKKKRLTKMGMDLSKTEVLQTGKMRKDFYPGARRGALFQAARRAYGDYADYGYDQEYDGYAFDEDAEYEMYEEAMSNLNRAQIRYDLALKLLQRTQQERLRRDHASRYYG